LLKALQQGQIEERLAVVERAVEGGRWPEQSLFEIDPFEPPRARLSG
jgi:hypothetical protein